MLSKLAQEKKTGNDTSNKGSKIEYCTVPRTVRTGILDVAVMSRVRDTAGRLCQSLTILGIQPLIQRYVIVSGTQAATGNVDSHTLFFIHFSMILVQTCLTCTVKQRRYRRF